MISSLYNNWDLEVEFQRDEWTVVLKGFLYSEEYENLNTKIARQGATSDDILDTIIANPHIFPTVSLDSQRLADLYGMNTERAQVFGKPVCIFDEFPENLQTAFDPPSSFHETVLQFFRKFMTKRKGETSIIFFGVLDNREGRVRCVISECTLL